VSKPTYDSVWKALPDIVLLALARLAEPRIGPSIRPWKTDIKALFDRDLDNAFLVEINGLLIILLMEYQNYADASMPTRIFHYVASLKLQYFQQHQQDIIVLPIVIWAIPGMKPAPVYDSALDADAGITCRYREIRLSEMDWHTVDPLLLVLAPYLHDFAPTDLETAAVQMYEAAPPEYRRLLLAALLSISQRKYKNIDAIEQAILQRVRVTMDEIFAAIAEGPIGLKIREQGKAEGLAEGEAKGKVQGLAEGEAKGKVQGLAEGEAKGKTEGLITAITVIWQHRFGALPSEIHNALNQAGGDSLQRVLEALAGTPSEAEVRALLGL
jgi:hypothetical protein